jgi:hypothetical protein
MLNRRSLPRVRSLADIVKRTPARHRPDVTSDVQRLHEAGLHSVAELTVAVRSPATDPDIRSLSCWAIAQTRPRGWIQLLGSVARVDPHAGVAHAAINGLLRHGSALARRAIHEALLNGVHPANRAAAAWALGTLRAKRDAALLVRVATRRREAVAVRAEAAEALGYLGNRLAVEPLIGLLDDPEGDVRANAAFALGNLADPRALPFLAKLSKDSTVAGSLGLICDVASGAAKTIRRHQEYSKRPPRRRRSRRPRSSSTVK